MNVFAELRGCETELIEARAEIKRLQVIVDKLPKWAGDLVQAQNQLHGIRGAAMGKRSVAYVEKAIHKAVEEQEG